MMKFLLFVGFLSAVYFIFFKKKTITNTHTNHSSSGDTMIPCEHCGTYVELKEAISHNGKSYCSSECLKEAA